MTVIKELISVHLHSLKIILYFSLAKIGCIQRVSWKLKMFMSYNLQVMKC